MPLPSLLSLFTGATVATVAVSQSISPAGEAIFTAWFELNTGIVPDDPNPLDTITLPYLCPLCGQPAHFSLEGAAQHFNHHFVGRKLNKIDYTVIKFSADAKGICPNALALPQTVPVLILRFAAFPEEGVGPEFPLYCHPTSLLFTQFVGADQPIYATGEPSAAAGLLRDDGEHLDIIRVRFGASEDACDLIESFWDLLLGFHDETNPTSITNLPRAMLALRDRGRVLFSQTEAKAITANWSDADQKLVSAFFALSSGEWTADVGERGEGSFDIEVPANMAVSLLVLRSVILGGTAGFGDVLGNEVAAFPHTLRLVLDAVSELDRDAIFQQWDEKGKRFIAACLSLIG